MPRQTTPSGNTVESGPVAGGRTGGTGEGEGEAEGRLGIVAAGTSMSLLTGQRVCTNTNTVGDRITATLTDAVPASNGVVIPAGSTVVLEVTSLQRSDRAGENMALGLRVLSVMHNGKSFPVDAEITSAQTEKVRSQNNDDAGKVLGGAVAGGILGRVLGGRSRTEGTIIGAAGGAAAGAILARKTATYNGCIPSGAHVTVKLGSPMSIQG